MPAVHKGSLAGGADKGLIILHVCGWHTTGQRQRRALNGDGRYQLAARRMNPIAQANRSRAITSSSLASFEACRKRCSVQRIVVRIQIAQGIPPSGFSIGGWTL